MPRLLDKLDAASGLVPEFLPDDVDYLTLRPSPERLILPDGTYAAGWYDGFNGEVNLAASSAMRMALQRWFHLTVDGPDHFVVANLANLTRGSNNALLVVDKRTGAFHQASITRLFPNTTVHVDASARHFHDRESGSFVRVHDAGGLEIALHAGGLHLLAHLEPALGPPLVQVTRFQRGRGALQWYGAQRVVHGSLLVNGAVCPIPPGTWATYDRTVGHMRGLQAWNWLAAAGTATDERTGEIVPVAIQIAQDRAEARPRVEARKYALWVGGALHRLSEANFAYEVLDPESRRTGPWQIRAHNAAGVKLDLTLTPQHQRREARARVLVRTDFNQYYGPVHGRAEVAGRNLLIHGLTAVAEDSLLEL